MIAKNEAKSAFASVGRSSNEAPAEKETILVLDDETSITEMISQHLCDEGYDCAAFTSPVKALKHLEQKPFSLLITDLKMPEMQGIEVTVRAKQLDDTLSVIVVTALLDVNNAIEAMRAGADDYLLKPFNLSEITIAVEKALSKRRLVIENRHYQKELEDRVRAATADLERANHELRQTKEYLEDLLDSTVDTILTADPEAKISYSNEGAQLMLGYTPQDLVGQPIARFIAGGAQEVRYLQRLLREEARVQNYESELLHNDGHFVPVSMSLSQVKDENAKTISTFAICRNITEQNGWKRNSRRCRSATG